MGLMDVVITYITALPAMFFDRRLTLKVELGYEDGIIQIFREDGAQKGFHKRVYTISSKSGVSSQENGSEKRG